ncbi:MAG: AAA family ATPase [Patescibacteria group bacterium]|nr:AAA family ATPase [Patescibacteria group bacterium]
MYNKVTISGLICTGKTTLFWGLQEKLGWPTFSASQFFRDYARTYHVSLEKAEEQSEKLTKKVDFQTRALLQKNKHLIIEGWMAGIMADGFTDVLRILLTCDENIRISRFAKRNKVSLKKAETSIKEREKNLFDVLEKIYHRNDFTNPQNYNFILDTTALANKQVIRAVLNKLGMRG